MKEGGGELRVPVGLGEELPLDMEVGLEALSQEITSMSTNDQMRGGKGGKCVDLRRAIEMRDRYEV